MNRYKKMQEIVANQQAERVDGMLIDMSSANIYCQVYELLSEEHQDMLEGFEIVKAMRMVWDLSVR